MAPDSLSGAYGVLERLGLLKKEAPPAPEEVLSETVVPATQPPAAAQTTTVAVSGAERTSPHAYQVLRRLGLLSPGPGAEAPVSTKRSGVEP